MGHQFLAPNSRRRRVFQLSRSRGKLSTSCYRRQSRYCSAQRAAITIIAPSVMSKIVYSAAIMKPAHGDRFIEHFILVVCQLTIQWTPLVPRVPFSPAFTAAEHREGGRGGWGGELRLLAASRGVVSVAVKTPITSPTGRRGNEGSGRRAHIALSDVVEATRHIRTRLLPTWKENTRRGKRKLV
ncbi:hypothetical protein MTO96_016617 [Rhipicephalus appendiculatus]